MNKVTQKHRFLYGFGYMGVLVSGIVFTTFVTYFYLQHIKLNPAWVGIGFGVVSVWEAIIAPFVGYISDRTRTRWGRRVPYVVVGIPLMAIFLWLVFNPAFDASQPTLALAWFMITLFILDSIFMTIDVNWQAVNAEMNVDLASRSQQGAIVGVLSMLGVAAASAAFLPLAEKLGWSTTVTLVAGFSTIVGYIGVLGLKENPSFSKPQALGLKDAVRFTLSYRPSLFFMGLAIIVKIAMFAITTMIPLFAVWVLTISEGQSGTLLLASSGGMLIFFPIASVLINKIGPKKALTIGFLEVAAVALILILRIYTFPLLVALFGLFAIGFSLMMLSLMIMLSDVIDADAVKVGQRREGIYNSAYALVQRLGAFLFSVSMGLALSAAGFQSELSAQNPSVLLTIKGLLAGVPLAVCLIGLFVIGKYPINDEQAKEIRSQAIKQREAFITSGELENLA